MAFENLNQGWGGVRVSPATNTAPLGQETAPVTRPILRKQNYLYTASIGTSQTYVTPWIDTLQTGDLHVEVTARTTNTAGNPPGYRIEGTDDIGSPNTFVVTLSYYLQGSGSNLSINTGATLNANVTTRYWRVVFTNGATGPANIELAITASPMFMPSLFPAYSQQTPQAQTIASQRAPMVLTLGGSNQFYSLCVAMGLNPSSNSWVDGQAGTVVAGVYAGSGGSTNAAFGVLNSVYNGSSWDRQRTIGLNPKSAQATSNGNTAVWTPTSGKKFRLMRFKIQVTANAAISGGAAVLTVDLNDAGSSLGVAHDVFIPASAGTSMTGAYDSGWITLDNGLLSAAANNVLNVNLSATLTSGNVRVIAAGTEE